MRFFWKYYVPIIGIVVLLVLVALIGKNCGNSATNQNLSPEPDPAGADGPEESQDAWPAD